jgi:hypothetical protein
VDRIPLWAISGIQPKSNHCLICRRKWSSRHAERGKFEGKKRGFKIIRFRQFAVLRESTWVNIGERRGGVPARTAVQEAPLRPVCAVYFDHTGSPKGRTSKLYKVPRGHRMLQTIRRKNIQRTEELPAATTDHSERVMPYKLLAGERTSVPSPDEAPRVRGIFILALALALPAYGTASLAEPATATPDGPISIIYRDDVSNERTLNGVAQYTAVLGRDRSVNFIVKNQSAVQVCDGTFTREGPNNGKFSLSCLRGLSGNFSGSGNYERMKGRPNDRFTARGQTSLGFPIMLIIGRPIDR